MQYSNNIKKAFFANEFISFKVVFSILFLLIFVNINAQRNAFESEKEIQILLEKKYNFEKKNLKLKFEFEKKSLIGKHVHFSITKSEIPLKNFYFKVHLDNLNRIFLVQENISKTEKINFIDDALKPFDKNYKFKDNLKVASQQFVYVLNSEKNFVLANEVVLYNEAKDIYLERIYQNKNEFSERNLKVFLHPIDTIIKGKVFLPDPLSSAAEEYGTYYQDAFKKDTTLLIISTIPNTGQTTVTTGVVPFSIYGTTFNVNSESETNTFSATNIYYVFENIYLDVNHVILGYNTKIVDDLNGLETQIIIEDFNFPELENELEQIEVRGDFSMANFSLKNNAFEIVDISLPNILPNTSTNDIFYFNRSEKEFEEINAFYHLNNFHDYIESLGFLDLDPQKIIIDVHGNNGADNSFFVSTPSPRLVFGDGGVDDAEDAGVVIHEYVHALSDFASPNTNAGEERRAIDEALGDYFSVSYSLEYSYFNKGKVFPWDGHNEFWSGRINNSDSTYEALNLSENIYYNTPILSSTFMDLYDELGRETTDKLVMESMYLNVPYDSFQTVANNLLLIDSLLFNNDHKCAIYNVLTKRKFKKGLCIGDEIVTDKGLFTLDSEAFMNGNGNVKFFIVEENFKQMDVWVSNAMGEVVFKKINLKKPKLEIDSKAFSKGVYYIRFQTNNDKYFTKLMKQ